MISDVPEVFQARLLRSLEEKGGSLDIFFEILQNSYVKAEIIGKIALRFNGQITVDNFIQTFVTSKYNYKRILQR